MPERGPQRGDTGCAGIPKDPCMAIPGGPKGSQGIFAVPWRSLGIPGVPHESRFRVSFVSNFQIEPRQPAVILCAAAAFSSFIPLFLRVRIKFSLKVSHSISSVPSRNLTKKVKLPVYVIRSPSQRCWHADSPMPAPRPGAPCAYGLFLIPLAAQWAPMGLQSGPVGPNNWSSGIHTRSLP